jgi:hypothetical protein
MMTKVMDKHLVDEIRRALEKIDGYGSVELYIQDFKVTQITARNIRKTKNPIKLLTNS